jgi:hypothetical protein
MAAPDFVLSTEIHGHEGSVREVFGARAVEEFLMMASM